MAVLWTLATTAMIAMTCAAELHGGEDEGQDEPAPPATHGDTDWREAERGVLSQHVQLTREFSFARAGEAYFDPYLQSFIIFQATPRPEEGEEQSPHYGMYVARLVKDEAGNVTGLDTPRRVSPPGSANTCGFFDPWERGRVIFSSTLVPPTAPDKAGYQRESSRYAWAFPKEMDVCTVFLRNIAAATRTNSAVRPEHMSLVNFQDAVPLFERPGGYDAECAFSPDGQSIVYASADPESGDLDLWVWDRRSGESTKIVDDEGYDGGPFFSPDGKRICYRSDRAGNDLLQLYVADLTFDEKGSVTGISAEHQLTANEHVNWAPYWHPSGEFLVYATSEIGHRNYEVFSIEVPEIGGPGGDVSSSLRKKRITHAAGFDGLPVFSPDGQFLLWTSQRGPKLEGEQRPSSQLWIARVHDVRP
jgi:TolB protein